MASRGNCKNIKHNLMLFDRLRCLVGEGLLIDCLELKALLGADSTLSYFKVDAI